jgi:hypothetical protein
MTSFPPSLSKVNRPTELICTHLDKITTIESTLITMEAD